MAGLTFVLQNLKIRAVCIDDLEQVHALHSLQETDKYNTLGIPKTEDETLQIVRQWCDELEKESITKYTFAIEHRSDIKTIGFIALNLGPSKYKSGEVWYKLFPDYWGKGYATEALKGILDFGFSQLKLHRIEAGCAVDNIGSIKVLEKVGMTREGRKRSVLPLKNGWSDNFEYAIVETDPRI